MKYYAGILAGGIGSRMENANIPKQFLELNNIPIFIYTIRAFLNVEGIEHIFLAMNKNWIDYSCQELKKHEIPSHKVSMIEGGTTRFDTLCILAQQVTDLDPEAILISHDCARPFVSTRIIMDNMMYIQDYDMVTTSIPTIDTMLLSHDGKRSNTVPDRSTLYADQGPQSFQASTFIKLVNNLTSLEKENYIEAGRIYLKNHLSVGIVKGSRKNFKITNDIDLYMANAILNMETDSLQ